MPCPYICWRKLASHRKNSEDRAEVFERGDALVVVVADGAGGTRGGAAASAALVEAVRAAVENSTVDVLSSDFWAGLLRETDAGLAERMVGETTGVVVAVGPNALTGVSTGDSEAWIITRGTIEDLTHSQDRSRLGSGRVVPAGFQRRSLDGVLLVATDGLFRNAAAARIAATVREGDVSGAHERLAALAQLPSGAFPDDVGIVVVAPR